MTDCIIHRCKPNPEGYCKVYHEGKVVGAHRLAYTEHHGIPLSSIAGQLVRHKCDVRNCVNPEHLELGTHQDNTDDRESRGRGAKGERSGAAKLTDAQCLEMRAVYVKGSKTHGSVALAAQYGVSHRAALDVVKGVRHVS